MAAIEPTIDASAPSARCVCPRITPGCSSNVRLTRSSNSRMRSIWVKAQTRSRPASCVTEAPSVSLSCDARAELRVRRLVRPPEDLLHREVAQLVGEDLHAPRPRVAVLAARLHVRRDVELALARQPAMVDGLVDEVVHVLAPTVAQLDPAQVLGRDALELLGVDPELRHVPRVDRDTAVRRARALDDRTRSVEAMDVHVKGHQLVDDRRRVVIGRLRAQLGETLGDLLERRRGAGDVADLDVVRIELRGSVEQQPPLLVRCRTPLVVGVEEPVHEELELEMLEARAVEDLLHLAQRPRLEHMGEIGVPDADAAEADARRLLAAVAPIERRPLAPPVPVDGTGQGPVEAHQLDVAHRSLLLARARPCRT